MRDAASIKGAPISGSPHQGDGLQAHSPGVFRSLSAVPHRTDMTRYQSLAWHSQPCRISFVERHARVGVHVLGDPPPSSPT